MKRGWPPRRRPSYTGSRPNRLSFPANSVFTRPGSTPEQLGQHVLKELHNPRALAKDIMADIRKGADVNQRDTAGTTMLMRAVVKADIEVFELIISKGADINACNKHGDTALIHAACANQEKMVKRLLQLGAPVDQCDNNQSTPLMCAARRDSRKVIDILLANRADINAVNLEGETALLIAIDNRNEKAARLLMEQGATLGTKTKDGRTLADLARKKGMSQLAADIETTILREISAMAQKGLPTKAAQTRRGILIPKRPR